MDDFIAACAGQCLLFCRRWWVGRIFTPKLSKKQLCDRTLSTASRDLSTPWISYLPRASLRSITSWHTRSQVWTTRGLWDGPPKR